MEMTKYPISTRIRTIVCRKLLDICDRHSKDLLATNMPDGEREVYRQTLEDYNKHYKYTGKV